jgi:hypothetical protein
MPCRRRRCARGFMRKADVSRVTAGSTWQWTADSSATTWTSSEAPASLHLIYEYVVSFLRINFFWRRNEQQLNKQRQYKNFQHVNVQNDRFICSLSAVEPMDIHSGGAADDIYGNRLSYRPKLSTWLCFPRMKVILYAKECDSLYPYFLMNLFNMYIRPYSFQVKMSGIWNT